MAPGFHLHHGHPMTVRVWHHIHPTAMRLGRWALGRNTFPLSKETYQLLRVFQQVLSGRGHFLQLLNKSGDGRKLKAKVLSEKPDQLGLIGIGQQFHLFHAEHFTDVQTMNRLVHYFVVCLP